MEDFFTGFQGRYVSEVTGVFKILGYEPITLQSDVNVMSTLSYVSQRILYHTTYQKKSAWSSRCGV